MEHTRGRGRRPRDEVERRSRENNTAQGLAARVHSSQTSSSSSSGFQSHQSELFYHQQPGMANPSRSAVQPPRGVPNLVPPGKVAIPALKQPRRIDPVSTTSKKGRTAHACDNCRKSKSGCTGEIPSCLKCKNAGVSCVYGDGKRDKDRKYGT